MKFTIITPSFNQGRFLQRTIDSVLGQGYADLEYIVIDGGSTDESIEILKSNDEGIHYWVSESDRGQAHAVNKGLALASGDVIGWLNSDDVYRPGALHRVARHFLDHPECLFAYGDADYIDPEDQVTGKYPVRDWDFKVLTRHCFLCQPSVFFRREVIARFGDLDENLRFCMDYEYWLRCGSEVPFTRISGTLSASRLHQENKTLSSRHGILEEAANMLKSRLGYVPRRWLAEYAHEMVSTSLPDQFGPMISLRQSWQMFLEWHRLHWRFNHGWAPLYPRQFFLALPILKGLFSPFVRLARHVAGTPHPEEHRP